MFDIKDFLKPYRVEADEKAEVQCTLTSLEGGSWSLSSISNRRSLFEYLAKTGNELRGNKPRYLSEVFPPTGVFRPVLDIDAPDEYVLNGEKKLIIEGAAKGVLREWFNMPTEFKIESSWVSNNMRPNRAKLYIHNLNITKAIYQRWVLTLRKRLSQTLDLKDEAIDIASGNRLIYSYKPNPKPKVEGRDDIYIPTTPNTAKGYYAPEGSEITPELFERYSIFPSEDRATMTFGLRADVEQCWEKEESRKKQNRQSEREWAILTDEQAREILDNLGDEFCDNFYQWKTICMAMCNLGVSQDIVCQWSMRSSKWDDSASESIDRWWSDYDPETPYGGANKFGTHTLRRFLRSALGREKADELELEIKLADVRYEDFILKDDEGMGRLARKLLGSTLKVTFEQGDPQYAFNWNEDEKLWVPLNHAQTMTLVITHTLIPIVVDVIKRKREELKKTEDEEDEDEKTRKKKKTVCDALEKRYGVLLKNAGQTACFNTVSRHLSETSFKQKLDRIESLWMPLRDGTVYNIQTQELRPRVMTDYYSKHINAKIVSDTSEAEAYCREVFSDGWKRAVKIFGYCWTPNNQLKLMFICIGERNSGKTKFLKLTIRLMGTRHKAMKDRAIMKGNQAAHNDELLHAIKNTTLATFTEAKEEHHFDESILKAVTGGDLIGVRACGGNTENIECNTKLMVSTNTQPKISSDPATLARLCYLFFPNHFDETNIEEKTKMEKREQDQEFYDQLFTVQMRGAADYYASGKIDDDKKAREEYLGQNPAEGWLCDACVIETDARFPVTYALDKFKSWVRINGSQIMMSDSEFRDFMKKRFGEPRNLRVSGAQTRCYVGLRERTSRDDEQKE